MSFKALTIATILFRSQMHAYLTYISLVFRQMQGTPFGVYFGSGKPEPAIIIMMLKKYVRAQNRLGVGTPVNSTTLLLSV